MPCVKKENFSNSVRKTEQVPLPEIGHDAYVVVRELGARDLLDLQSQHGKAAETNNLQFVYQLLALTLVDDGGNQLFTDVKDVESNFNLPLPSLTRLGEEVCRISGLSVKEKN